MSTAHAVERTKENEIFAVMFQLLKQLKTWPKKIQAPTGFKPMTNSGANVLPLRV